MDAPSTLRIRRRRNVAMPVPSTSSTIQKGLAATTDAVKVREAFVRAGQRALVAPFRSPTSAAKSAGWPRTG